MAAPGLDERFIGALHDALAADIDPRPGRHLAEHHQSFAVEFVKMLPRGPMRNQVRIGDQNARRIGMVRKTPTGFPDCTSKVSSASSLRSASTMRSNASQLRAARLMPPQKTSWFGRSASS